MNFLLTAHNGSLIIGMIIGVILFALFGFIAVSLLFKPSKTQQNKEKNNTLLLIPIGLSFCAMGLYLTLLEYNLLTNFVYLEATTLDYCNEDGAGIEVEYYVKGIRHTKCETYDRIEDIKVPGGKFCVRVTEFNTDIGRVDFDQPLTKDSRKHY